MLVILYVLGYDARLVPPVIDVAEIVPRSAEPISGLHQTPN